MKKWKLCCYRAALRLVPPPKGTATASRGLEADRARQLADILRAQHAYGAAVALFDRKRVTGVLTYGTKRQAVLENTAFRAASVSKLVTAMAVWRLKESGRLDLDADVSPYLPPLPHPVTLRQLLSHTSGICDGRVYAAARSHPVPLAEVLQGDSFSGQVGRFAYSNLGAGLVACVLARMFDMPFEELMQQVLFAPLKVEATFQPQKLAGSVANTYRVLPPRRAPALDNAARRARAVDASYDNYLLAQGNLYISAPMLAVLGQELMRERYAPMRKAIAPFGARDPHLSEGLGMFIIKDARLCAPTLYGHQGLAYSSSHGLFFDPEAGQGVAVLTAGCSEAREHVLTDLNKAIIKQVFA